MFEKLAGVASKRPRGATPLRAFESPRFPPSPARDTQNADGTIRKKEMANDANITRQNHYVPELYQKQFLIHASICGNIKDMYAEKSERLTDQEAVTAANNVLRFCEKVVEIRSREEKI